MIWMGRPHRIRRGLELRALAPFLLACDSAWFYSSATISTKLLTQFTMEKKIHVSTHGATDWKQFLAEPEKQWKDGFSAKELAQRWEAVDGFPDSVVRVLRTADEQELHDMKMLLAIPEYKVHLPGGSRASILII